MTASGEQTSASPWRGARVARALLVASACVAVAFLAVKIVRARHRRAALGRVTESLDGYAECMLGAPLAPGETAAQRLRRIEAGLPEVAEGGAAAPEPWPARCREDLAEAHATLATGDLTRGAPDAEQAAVTRLDSLVVDAAKDPSPEGAPGLIDDLLRAATLAGAPVKPRLFPAPGRRPAPAPAAPLPASELAPLPVPIRAAPDELPGIDPLGLQLAFLDHKEAGWTCAFNPLHGEPLREVRCAELRRGEAAVLREEAARSPGYLRTVRERFDRFEIVRPLEGALPSVTPLTSSIDTVALYGDQLVWVAGHRWFARTVTPGKAPLGEPVDLGEVVGLSPELAACPTRTALLVSVKTYDTAGEPGSWRAMAARVNDTGQWRRTPGRAAVDVGATWTCEGHAGTFTWFDRRVVTQVRCNADRCETHASADLALPWDVGGPLYAGDLGGRALLLGLGTTPGPLTGRSVASVRMRLAPLAAITKAPDDVIFSDLAHDGAPLSNVSVYVRDGVALLLLLLDDEKELPLRAIRLDGLGEFRPVIVAN